MNPEEYHLMYQIEDHYWWYRGMQRITFALLNSHLAKGTELKVLDAGCGTGGMIAPLGKLGSVVGVDFCAEATALSNQRQPGAITRGSITSLPFATASFDLVTCFDVIYHLAVSDDKAALREIGRVLKPGGKLLIRVPAYNFLRGKHDVAVHTRHRYSLGELVAKLRGVGFNPVKATYANTLLFPLAAAKRLWETLSPSTPSAESDLKPLPGPMNDALLGILTLESRLVKRASLPFGLSAICLATKEG